MKNKIIIPPHLKAKLKEEQKDDLSVKSTQMFKEFQDNLFFLLNKHIVEIKGEPVTPEDQKEIECVHVPVAMDASVKTYFYRGQPIICAIPPRLLKQDDKPVLRYGLNPFSKEDQEYQDYALRVYAVYKTCPQKDAQDNEPVPASE